MESLHSSRCGLLQRRFADPDLESEYRQQQSALSRQSNRRGLYVSGGAWIVSVLAIFLAYPNQGPAFTIAVFTVVPILVVAIWSSYSRRWLNISQWMAALTNLSAGLLVIYAGVLVLHDATIYVVGMIMVVFFAPFILRVPFPLNLAVSLVNLVLAEGIVIIYRPFPTTEVPVVLAGIFLGWAASTFGAEFLDRSDRNVYLLRRELETTNAKLRQENCTDTLTGLHNRQYFFQYLDGEILAARRYENPLCLAMLDIDDFKRINDEHGHITGDAALRQFADLIRRCFRKSDMTARFGGEEFIILFRNLDLEESTQALDRFLTMVREWEFEGVSWPVTFSAGAVELTDGQTGIEFAESADDLLLKAKSQGKNRILTA